MKNFTKALLVFLSFFTLASIKSDAAEIGTYRSKWVSQSNKSGPNHMVDIIQGDKIDIWINFMNNGTRTWKKDTNIKLSKCDIGNQPSLFASDDWLSQSRVKYLPNDVAPGQVTTFISL